MAISFGGFKARCLPIPTPRSVFPSTVAKMLLFAGPKILVFSRVPPLRSERGRYPGQKILARRTRACANAKAFPAVRIPSALSIHKNGWRCVVAMVNADGDRDARGRHAMVESPPDPALGHRTAREALHCAVRLIALPKVLHRSAAVNREIALRTAADLVTIADEPCAALRHARASDGRPARASPAADVLVSV